MTSGREPAVLGACTVCGRRSRVSFSVQAASAVVAQTLRCPGEGCQGHLVVACPVTAVAFRVELIAEG